MIIAKGNLNYETLSRDLQRPAFYIFKIKCHNVRESLAPGSDFELGDVVLIKH
jgi:uncharacterized protein with ATP-grasp and redox domains